VTTVPAPASTRRSGIIIEVAMVFSEYAVAVENGDAGRHIIRTRRLVFSAANIFYTVLLE
jgi:hypothetical protein